MTVLAPERTWRMANSLELTPTLAAVEVQPSGSFRLFGRLDGITVVALALILVVGLKVIGDHKQTTRPPQEAIGSAATQRQPEPVGGDRPGDSQTTAPAASASAPFVSPYANYVLTQGLHGRSYGHLAVDLSAGEGATIRSPIEGVVTGLSVDGLGNTILVVENSRHQVTMLHGLYDVSLGEEVQQGQPLGSESNQGNTRDWLGRSCRDRDCGYHTHLNVFDKKLGGNVNPLDLLAKQPG